MMKLTNDFLCDNVITFFFRTNLKILKKIKKKTFEFDRWNEEMFEGDVNGLMFI